MTNQQLEKTYRVPIEDLNDVETEVKVRCKPTKLSEAFRLAMKELQQIKGYVGDRRSNKACASGALAYYFGDPNTKENDIFSIHRINPEIEEQINVFESHLQQTTPACGIVELNNDYGWTFERFAEEAEKLGL